MLINTSFKFDLHFGTKESFSDKFNLLYVEILNIRRAKIVECAVYEIDEFLAVFQGSKDHIASLGVKWEFLQIKVAFEFQVVVLVEVDAIF